MKSKKKSKRSATKSKLSTKPKASAKPKKEVRIVTPVKKDATVFLRLQSDNKAYLEAQAQKSKVSVAEYVNQVVSQMRGA